jgi:hypothetical protein
VSGDSLKSNTSQTLRLHRKPPDSICIAAMIKRERGVTVELGRTTIDAGWDGEDGETAAVWGVWMLGVLLLMLIDRCKR